MGGQPVRRKCDGLVLGQEGERQRIPCERGRADTQIGGDVADGDQALAIARRARFRVQRIVAQPDGVKPGDGAIGKFQRDDLVGMGDLAQHEGLLGSRRAWVEN